MELKEGLEFYRSCLEHCDKVIASLSQYYKGGSHRESRPYSF